MLLDEYVAVVGGGPAGMSCSLWLDRLGLKPVLVESGRALGGAQMLSPFENTWFLGTQGTTGQELGHRFSRHIAETGIPTQLECTLSRITRVPDGFVLASAQGEVFVRSIVIATGQRYIGFEAVKAVPGSETLQSAPNVCFNPGATATLRHDPAISGAVVGVVGGGDNALVTAFLTGAVARHVHLFVRSGIRAFGTNRRAVHELVDAGRLTLHTITGIEQFGTDGPTVRMTVGAGDGGQREVAVDYLCFRLGFQPNTEECQRLLAQGGVGDLELTGSGHIATDGFLRTSIRRIYAAGDVANPRDPCVATALAQGAIAARSVEEDLGLDAWDSPEPPASSHDSLAPMPATLLHRHRG